MTNLQPGEKLKTFEVSYTIVKRIIKAPSAEEAMAIFCQQVNLNFLDCAQKLVAKEIKE